MKIKYQYLIFIVLLHIVLTTLIYFVLEDNKWYFVLSELLIILSLVLSYKIYASFIKPIELMKTGVSAIKEKDYNVRFLSTNSTEMNDLIEVFNTMLDKLGEEKVRTEEQGFFLENLISASPIGMIILGFDGEITSINASARRLFGLGQEGSPSFIREIQHALAKDIVKIKSGDNKIITTEGVRKYRCQVNEVIHKGFKRKFVMIEELSKELLTTEKEAYGKIIRMMAHEVNNSMGAVNSILQSVVEFGYEGAGSDNEYVESLNIAIDRNEDLAQFMKNFASVIRLPQPALKSIDVVELIDKCRQLMTPQANDADTSIVSNYKTTSLILNLDPQLMQQVFVNIIKNAIESIGSKGNIKITITADKPQIIIADNGPGISPEAKEKLFSPFFSTKPTGQGIGLIIIRDILLGHGATFSLETDPVSGWTEFRIGFGV